MTELRELQIMYLDMLKDFIKICNNANINYWLDSGTLLGAVRHKGFIPWDDDIDVGILEENISNLIEAYNLDFELSKKYLLQEYKCHNYHSYYQFSKKEKNILSSGKEVLLFMDIFPYKKYKKTFYFSLINLFYSPIKYRTEKFYLKYFFINIFVRIISEAKNIFNSLRNIELQSKIAKETENRGGGSYLGYSYKCGFHINLYKIEEFFPLIEKEFEGIKIKIPKNYDEILKNLYGDYMTPPSENKRKLHHFRDLKF